MTMLSNFPPGGALAAGSALAGTGGRRAVPATSMVAGRDMRLDVFRGLGMMIILIAHIPWNDWALWIPGRFGFSDATEIFVFLSGVASAIAYGRTFDRQGAGMLTARVAYRIWQIWWAHIGLFVVLFALMVRMGPHYLDLLNLGPVVADPGLLLHLMRLSYVPNYFDILPMYMVILAMMPAMLLAERLHPLAPFVLMVGLWAVAQAGVAPFSAEPWSDRPWFFDPFGWQFLFYLGFFLRRGSFRLPRPEGAVLAAAVAVVVVTIPFAWFRILDAVPVLNAAAVAIHPLTDKSAFGILRLVHFLALAAIGLRLAGPGGLRLRDPRIAPLTGVLEAVGQQPLAAFLTGMGMAQVLGILLDHVGRTAGSVTAANLAGLATVAAAAMAVGWFKSAPWKERPR